MEPKELLPRRVINYINEMGVRSLDHLADNYQSPGAHGAAPDAVQALIDHWRSMSATEKVEFVGRVSESVVEVVAASAALPLGLKLGRKAVKATRKVIKRRSKKLRKESERATAAVAKVKAEEPRKRKQPKAAKPARARRKPAPARKNAEA